MARASRETRTYPWEQPGERFTFATPEQVEVTYRVASFGARLVAAFLDLLLIVLLSALLAVGLIAYVASQPPAARLAVAGYALALYLILNFILQTFYFVWSELRHEGRTWGKKKLKLRTVMLSGHGLTFGGSILRNLARLVDVWPILWIVPALTPGQRRLGDLLAGTIVINESEGDAAGAAVSLAPSYRELEDRRFFFSAETQSRLYPEDLNLLEHMFARARDSGDRKHQNELFLSVATKYIERLGVEEQRALAESEPRRFLEELYLLLRDRFEASRF